MGSQPISQRQDITLLWEFNGSQNFKEGKLDWQNFLLSHLSFHMINMEAHKGEADKQTKSKLSRIKGYQM